MAVTWLTAKARQQQLGGIDLVTLPTSGSYDEAIAAEVAGLGNGRVGFDDAHMTVRQHRDLLRGWLPSIPRLK